ncbi:MAG: flagellar hook-basal body complex protein [Aeoliella sp.]
MGLQSALNTALTGLQAAETTIDVVGNNVANSNTVGFKESEAVFATQFLQTIGIGSAPTANQGGTNPRQIGLGVKVAAVTPNFSQGTIEISSNPLDVAIQGDGFLMVQNGTGRLYTRNGQLQLNANNEVVTTTGQRVLGYGVNDNFVLATDSFVPLSIPLGQERVAQATENAFLAGVLNPSVQQGTLPEITESAVLGNGAIDAPDDTNFGLADIQLTTTPSTATLTTTGAGTGPGSGIVRYRVGFLDVNGRESNFSTEFSIDNTGGGAVDLTNIQPSDGSIWLDRVIYRTEADGSSFFRVGTIGDATTTTFNDTLDDATLITQAAIDDATIEAGSYNYYVTYYNPSTGVETRPTDRVGAVAISDTSGGRIRLDLSDLPAPDVSNPNMVGFTQMRLYRSTSNSSDYRRLPVTTPLVVQGETGYVDTYVDSFSNSALESEPELDLNGPPASNGNLLSDIVVRSGDSYITPFEPGTLTFAAEKDGVELSPKSLDIEASTTVLELVNFMRDALGLDQQSSTSEVPFPNPTADVEITADGRLRITSNFGQENAIDVPLTAFKLIPTGKSITETVTLNFSSTQTADGPGTSSEFLVYDSLGLPLKVRVTTVLETKDSNSTTYRWYATSANNEPVTGLSTVVGDGVLVFDGNGDLDENTFARISIGRNDTASESPLEINLDFSSVTSLGEVDALQNPVSSLNVTRQDGFPPGVLTDFIISETVLIQGQFSNGTQRTIGQMIMAKFANNSGLQQVGDSLFQTGVNSGEPVFSRPGEDGIGTLTAGAVELSNTDIGQNLIELILASTQYRGGARVITASQELLDELLALRR